MGKKTEIFPQMTVQVEEHRKISSNCYQEANKNQNNTELP